MSRDSNAHLGEQTMKVIDDVKELGHVARDAATQGMDRLQRSSRRAASRAVKRAGDYEERAASYVSERPLKSVLIAVGAGLLVGFFLHRR